QLAAKSDEDLIRALSHPSLWHRQTAVRLLAERKAKIPGATQRLAAPGAHPALEILWVLHQTGALDDALALHLLDHPSPLVRAWTIRLCGDAKQLTPSFLQAVITRCATEPSAEVRSQILSTS